MADKLKSAKDRQLLEAIFYTQVIIHRKVDRIDNALSELYRFVDKDEKLKSYPSHAEHLDQNYDKITELIRTVKNQLSQDKEMDDLSAW